MTEDEMVGWHHQFNGLFEQTPGDGIMFVTLDP